MSAASDLVQTAKAALERFHAEAAEALRLAKLGLDALDGQERPPAAVVTVGPYYHFGPGAKVFGLVSPGALPKGHYDLVVLLYPREAKT